MPFCPECRFEYQPSVHRCPDCGIDLVESLPEGKAQDTDASEHLEEALLCTVEDEIHAALLQDVLVQEGIRVRLQSGPRADGLVNLLRLPAPMASPMSTAVRVYVGRDDLRRAQTIYDDFERVGIEETELGPPPEESERAD